ncbi:MAG: glucosamine-6-phosphate deaminase [Bacilli bacterium]|jgi:glucosamine-6-phosphate deaminase|nr:glucosamine-6-phosphate deaminase [Bacilli bacterium]
MKIIEKTTADAIAEEVSDRIIDLVKKNPHAILGLATGSSPIPTYEKIIAKAQAQKVDFSQVITFNLDEYLNNPDETQSYRYFMATHLFDHINIRKENTHFPSLERLDQYDEDIKKAGGIDLQLLGIGADGHIGFNEPGTPFDSKTHIADLKAQTIQDNARFFKSIKDVPTQAVTMGMATIMQAKSIILIATGANKAKAIQLTASKIDPSCPASLLQRHKNSTIYVDTAAASLLGK